MRALNGHATLLEGFLQSPLVLQPHAAELTAIRVRAALQPMKRNKMRVAGSTSRATMLGGSWRVADEQVMNEENERCASKSREDACCRYSQ